MGVPLRHRDRLMPQDVTQKIQVPRCHDPLRGECVPEVVEVQIGEPGTLACVRESLTDTFELLPGRICKYQIGTGMQL